MGYWIFEKKKEIVNMLMKIFKPIFFKMEYIKNSYHSYYFICENDGFLDYTCYLKLEKLVSFNWGISNVIVINI